MVTLEVKHIGKHYGEGENRVQVLRNVSLSIEKGDFVAIIGQSGSGKSTLMNILGCLDTPSEGSYFVDGIATDGLGPDDLARLRGEKFGFIFQRYNLLTSLSARENVALPAVYAGMGSTQRNTRAEELLHKLGLEGKTTNRPNELSGGQQQRVSIARAMMKDAPVIILDEATANVDPENEQELVAAIEALTREKTILMIAHRLKTVRNADKILVVDHGKIVQEGRHQELMAQDGIYRWFVNARSLAAGWKLPGNAAGAAE